MADAYGMLIDELFPPVVKSDGNNDDYTSHGENPEGDLAGTSTLAKKLENAQVCKEIIIGEIKIQNTSNRKIPIDPDEKRGYFNETN